MNSSATLTSMLSTFMLTTAVPTRIAPSSSRSLSGSMNISMTTDCQGQLASWSTVTSRLVQPFPTNVTSTFGPYERTTSAIEGTGAIYTTVDGFAYATGNFTPTSTFPQLWTSYDTITYPHVISTPAAFVNVSLPPSPTCTIPATSCASLYLAYESSLGINPATAGLFGPDLPFIWPVPSNSPRCSHTLTTCTGSTSGDGCYVSANTVQVFYWPSASITGTITQAPHPAAASAIVTQVLGNVTMTSPSIYLSFDTLAAYSQIGLDLACADGPRDGGASLSQLGGIYRNALYSLDPAAISTLEMMYLTSDTSSTFPDSAISALKNPDEIAYRYWISKIAYDYNSLLPKALTYSDLTKPNPRAYYLRPHDFDALPLGCNQFGPHSGCNTIYQDIYRAQLSIPAILKSQDPAWAACSPGIRGVYDPPRALTAVNSAAAVSTTPQVAPTVTSASPATLSWTVTPVATTTAGARSVSSKIAPAIAESILLDSSATSHASAQATTVQNAVLSAQTPQTIVFSLPPSETQAGNTIGSAADGIIASTLSRVPSAVFTAESMTITASSATDGVVLGDLTIIPGQASTVNGIVVSNAASGIVVQAVSSDLTYTSTQGQLPIAAGPVSSNEVTSVRLHTTTIAIPKQPDLTIAGVTITADQFGTLVVGTQTLKPGSIITIDGTTISLPFSRSVLVVNGESTILPTSPVSSAIGTYTTGSRSAANPSLVSTVQSNSSTVGSTVLPGMGRQLQPIWLYSSVALVVGMSVMVCL